MVPSKIEVHTYTVITDIQESLFHLFPTIVHVYNSVFLFLNHVSIQIMLPAEVDERLPSLISFTESNRFSPTILLNSPDAMALS